MFVIHIPEGGDTAAKRTMIRRIHQAVAMAYGLPDFMVFLHEHSLATVAADGVILADDQQRVEEQQKVYSSPGPE